MDLGGISWSDADMHCYLWMPAAPVFGEGAPFASSAQSGLAENCATWGLGRQQFNGNFHRTFGPPRGGFAAKLPLTLFGLIRSAGASGRCANENA